MKKLIISILLFASQLATAQTIDFDPICLEMTRYYNETYYMWADDIDTYSITSDNDGWYFENLSEAQAYEVMSIIRQNYNIWELNDNLTFYDQQGNLVDRSNSQFSIVTLVVVDHANGGGVIGAYHDRYGFLPQIPRRFFNTTRL